jgi:predicted ATPase/DNA-binding SARP family transcriptional activator
VEFRVLGPLEVLSEGETLPLGGGKQRALLAVLLLHANEVVSSDRLIDLLWGEEPPETAAKALQVHVSQLRKGLESADGEDAERALKTRSPGYVLEIDPDQLDLHRFERLAAEGRRALDAADPNEAAEKLDSALALWRGPALADLAYADFAQAEAARIEELRLAALENRVQADLERGRHSEAIGELERLIAAEPLRERPRAQLMLALYRSGRQAEALEAFAATRTALVDGLGIEPGRELKELHQAILQQDLALDLRPAPDELSREPVEAEVPDRAARRDAFVGRERELAQFREAFEGALAGRTSLLLIAGEPGIGKSRLADEFASAAEAVGAKVFWGRCWEAGGAPPYWPWVQALRACIREGDRERVREELQPTAADIAQMLPELHELFPDLPPPPSLDPEGARFRLFDSTASFLRATGEERPLVLVLDDLHAADEPSLLLLRFLADSLHDARLVVVGAYRDSEPRREGLNEAIAEARREPGTRHIRLGGLDVGEVAEVIELTSGAQPTEQVAAAIHRETEGNPLFVGELVRLLASQGRLEEAVSEGGALSIPEGIRDVIDHRLRRLSDDCKRLLSVASVLGREFRLDALERVSEGSREELLDRLDEARVARVVVDPPAGREGFRFSHALIRDSLYGDLASSERLRLHQRTVEALEELYGAESRSHLAELAYHSLEAASGGNIDKAVEYARRAGDQAAAVLAYEEAARLYRIGLDALELTGPAEKETRCELLLALGDVQALGGNLAAAKGSFLEAAEIARGLNEPEKLAEAALGYGGRWAYLRAGKDRRLIPLLESALGALPAEDNSLRATLLARLAGALREHSDPERRGSRASLMSEAVEIARRLNDPRTLAYAVDATYSVLSWPRDTDRWHAIAIELLRLADETGDKEMALFAHFHVFGVSMIRGDVRAAETELELIRDLAHELRQPSKLWVALIAETMRLTFRGDFDSAEEIRARATEVGFAAQGPDATYYYVHNLQAWALRREQGRFGELEKSIESYVAEYPGTFVLRCVSAGVQAELGREVRARHELERLAADHFADIEGESEWFLGATVLAEVCQRLGDAARAELLYEALLPYAGYNVYASPEVALGSASRSLGLLASTMSRWEEAEGHFERALEMNTRMGTRPWVAHTQHDHARMLLARGDSSDLPRGKGLLSSALDTYRELGMKPWVERVEADLAELD